MKTYNGKSPLKHARFCNSNCKSGYMEDRRHGAIYGSILLEYDDGSTEIMGWLQGNAWCRECPYCGSDVSSPKALRAAGHSPVSY